MADSGTLTTQARAERDRFVAFAFAAADLLVEVDAAGKILFAAGALKSLTGQGADRLIGRPFSDMLSVQDRPLAKLLLRSIKSGGRMSPMAVRLVDASFSALISP